MTWVHCRRSVAVAVAAISVVAMASCVQEVPIVSNEPGNEITNMTLDEQREWVGEQFDAAIDASGIENGWFKSRRTLPWSNTPKDRDGVLGMLHPRDCSTGGRLIASLQNRSVEVNDPFAAAERVRTFWESEGWVVSDVLSYASDPYFRADREDGAVLAFRASTIGMSLEVETACSVHATVTNWQSRENEFADELERRGASSDDEQPRP
ncbi:hypothetical protein PQI23_00830 [Leucobacter sp. USCH14]|uniref:hypothetical protein n=1 Tax=Leucobacter sp. USCH14 TaxID=3024838 RepID=UPI0030AFFCAE